MRPCMSFPALIQRQQNAAFFLCSASRASRSPGTNKKPTWIPEAACAAFSELPLPLHSFCQQLRPRHRRLSQQLCQQPPTGVPVSLPGLVLPGHRTPTIPAPSRPSGPQCPLVVLPAHLSLAALCPSVCTQATGRERHVRAPPPEIPTRFLEHSESTNTCLIDESPVLSVLINKTGLNR